MKPTSSAKVSARKALKRKSPQGKARKTAHGPAPARPSMRGIPRTRPSAPSRSLTGAGAGATAAWGSLRVIPPKFQDVTIGAAISSSMTRHTRLSGDMNSTVTVHTLEPLVQLAYPNGATPVATNTFGCFRALGTFNGTGQVLVHPYTIGLKPGTLPYYEPNASTTWNTGHIWPEGSVAMLISLAFARYRVKSAKLHYCPTTATTELPQIVIAYSNDPAHPLFGVADSPALAYPSQSVIMTSANAVAFSAWAAWSAELPVVPQWFYRHLQPQYGTTTAVFPDSEVRESCWGCLCALSNGSGSADIPFGQLYLETEIEYMDPSPMTDLYAGGGVHPLAELKLLGLPGPEDSKETKEEKKDSGSGAPGAGAAAAAAPAPLKPCDEDDEWDRSPDTRRFPAPSAVPGGSAYEAGRPPSLKRTLGMK